MLLPDFMVGLAFEAGGKVGGTISPRWSRSDKITAIRHRYPSHL
jgi:hypothetical protein